MFSGITYGFVCRDRVSEIWPCRAPTGKSEFKIYFSRAPTGTTCARITYGSVYSARVREFLTSLKWLWDQVLTVRGSVRGFSPQSNKLGH